MIGPGLERCRIIPEDAPFVETLILTAAQPLIAPSDGDDLKREVGFYDLALTLAREGRNKLTELGEPVRRPKDFFCEMVKSDQHMARVKESLVVQQKKIRPSRNAKPKKLKKIRQASPSRSGGREVGKEEEKAPGDRRLAQGVAEER